MNKRQELQAGIYAAERQGLTPVPVNLRQGRFWPIFSIFCNSMMNPATLVTSGLMLGAGLPVLTTVLIQALSASFGMLPFLVLARVGARDGIPGQIFCRAVFGYRGSRWLTSWLRVICSVYWYAFQTLAAMMAVDAILQNFQINIPLGWLASGFAALQGGVALAGYGGMTRLSSLTLPLKVVGFLILGIWLVLHGGEQASFSSVMSFQLESWTWPVVLVWINGIAASMLSITTDAADFSRYTQKAVHLDVGVCCGVVAGTAAGALFGAWCVAAGGASSINPFETLVQLQPGGAILGLILLVTVLDAWTINVINLYTGGFSLANTFESLGRLKATGLVVASATVLALFPEIVHRYVDILSAAGAVFGPVSGILMGWCFRHSEQLNVPALYRKDGAYNYWQGWNLATCLPILPLTLLVLWIPAHWLSTIWGTLGGFLLFCLLDGLQSRERETDYYAGQG